MPLFSEGGAPSLTSPLGFMTVHPVQQANSFLNIPEINIHLPCGLTEYLQ
jgi:hypothetical protein